MVTPLLKDWKYWNQYKESVLQMQKINEKPATTIYSIRNHLYIIDDKEVLKINRCATPEEFKSELEELGHQVNIIEL